MTLTFRAHLRRRAEAAGFAVNESWLDPLEAYATLLAKWNARINLTALPVAPMTDEAIDRLFIEPLAAARHFPEGAVAWFDLGSGGGSPAIPLKVVHPSGSLRMVEAKSRKAAFLREVIRTLELPQAEVLEARFQDVAQARPASADVVTVRAVKLDDSRPTAASLLKNGGWLLYFGQHCDDSAESAVLLDGFVETGAFLLTKAGVATPANYLLRYSRSFHVEQKN